MPILNIYLGAHSCHLRFRFIYFYFFARYMYKHLYLIYPTALYNGSKNPSKILFTNDNGSHIKNGLIGWWQRCGFIIMTGDKRKVLVVRIHYVSFIIQTLIILRSFHYNIFASTFCDFDRYCERLIPISIPI